MAAYPLCLLSLFMFGGDLVVLQCFRALAAPAGSRNFSARGG